MAETAETVARKDEHNETKRESESVCSAKRADQTDTAADHCDEQGAHCTLSAVTAFLSRGKTKDR